MVPVVPRSLRADFFVTAHFLKCERSLIMVLKEIISRLVSGELDLKDYIDSLFQQIETREPGIQALIPGTYQRQRIDGEIATLLEKFPKPAKRPPLFGLPVGLKDIIRVDGFPTRCGSELPADLFKGAQAECVSRLQKAGAFMMGKTVSTEFAFNAPGPTRNPYNPEHTPGGSSSGSAAGVACGFFPVALGSQTVGSVIRPAAFCGVVGFNIKRRDIFQPFGRRRCHLEFSYKSLQYAYR